LFYTKKLDLFVFSQKQKKFKQGKNMCQTITPDRTYSQSNALPDFVESPHYLSPTHLVFIDPKINEVKKISEKNKSEVSEIKQRLQDIENELEMEFKVIRERIQKNENRLNKIENDFLIKLGRNIENLFDKILAILKSLPI
jgi:hypothetical protein